jgi:hypothetical protein
MDNDKQTLVDIESIIQMFKANILSSMTAVIDIEDQINIYKETIRKEERERAANICEKMVVGGRVWNDEQAIAADTLFAAAKNIRNPEL